MISIGTMLEGPLVTLAGGFAASTGLLDPFAVFAAAALGNLIGDSFWYVVGYFGQVNWIFSHPRLFALKKEQIEQLEKDIFQHAPRLLFIAKLTLGFSIPTLLAAGLARVPLRRWFWVQALAEVLWTGALTASGYFFGQYLLHVEQGIKLIAALSSALFLAIIFMYIKNFSQRKNQSN